MTWVQRIASVLSLKGLLSDWIGSRVGPLGGFVAAAVLVATDLGLRLLLTPWIEGAQFTALFPAVIVATLLFGTSAGLFAVLVTALAAAYTLSQAGLTDREGNSLLLFTCVALMDVAIISALLAANTALRASVDRIAHLNAGLSRSEAKFRNLLETAPDAMVIVDGEERIVLVNTAAEAMFGYPRAELMGQPMDKIMPERFRGQHRGRPDAFAAKPHTRRMGYGRELFGLRKDGSEFPIETNLSLLSGDDRLVSSAIRDVTQRKEVEERQALLIRELNHRVKNTLASVQAIVSQTLTTTRDPQDFSQAITARLSALSKSHDVLTRNDWLGARVRELVAEQLLPYGVREDGRFKMTGPDVKLLPNRAVTFGMVMGELATNAAKHGSLSTDAGRVDVTWARRDGADGPRLSLAWSETGGPRVRPPEGRGFGMRLIDRSLKLGLQGSAQLHFHSDGLTCEIEFPLLEGEA
jgi:PAS domain S-box-containing protein